MNLEDNAKTTDEATIVLTKGEPDKKPMSNTEFITELMDYSYYGALTQVFIIEAIRRYAEIIVAQPKPAEHGNGVISVIAWHEIAEEIKTRMEAAYGTTK